jgi:hypothetical protein
MRNAGVDVELRLRHSPTEGIQFPAFCPLCTRVREHGLGLTVNREDPKAATAILGLTDEQRAKHQYADAVRASPTITAKTVSLNHSEDRFAEHVLAPYG